MYVLVLDMIIHKFLFAVIFTVCKTTITKASWMLKLQSCRSYNNCFKHQENSWPIYAILHSH